MIDNYLPHEAKIIDKNQEGPGIFTLKLQFSDPEINRQYTFQPGQFNMLYLHGVGEIAISIVSDPVSDEYYNHTIRVVGRVTRGFEQLQPGQYIGIRGPYGRGWPLGDAIGKDIIVITGGLGCAPVISVFNYILNRRSDFGKISLMQGVKHSSDLIYKDRFEKLRNLSGVNVYVGADKSDKHWPWYKGRVIELVPKIELAADKTIAFMCGPEMMMKAAVQALCKKGMQESDLFLNMERNMQCAIGHCGHCQYGGKFICKDGPVFSYPEIKFLFSKEGF